MTKYISDTHISRHWRAELGGLAAVWLMVCGSAAPAAAQDTTVQSVDTLQRTVELERAYEPTTSTASKEFFTPQLGLPTSMRPLEFLRHDYEVRMRMQPRFAPPLQESRAVAPHSSAVHLRIEGGYPLRYGADVGMLHRIPDRGALELDLRHRALSQPSYLQRTAALRQRTSDTELGLRFTGKLQDRTLVAQVGLHHLMHTMYGVDPEQITADQLSRAISGDYESPMDRLTGGVIRVQLTPPVLSAAEAWRYHVGATLAYDQKREQPMWMADAPQGGGPTAQPLPDREAVTRAYGHLVLDGGLSYHDHFSGFEVGMGAHAETNRPMREPMLSAQYLSLSPHIGYTTGSVAMQVGARLDLVSFGARHLVLAPMAQVRWEATKLLAVTAEVDGGARMTSLRQMYATNRYARASSVTRANDVAQWDVALGMELGHINGFSARLRGGIAHYSSYYEWRVWNAPLALAAQYPDQLPRVYYTAEEAGAVRTAYLYADARYISPIGLQVAGALRYTHQRLAGATAPVSTGESTDGSRRRPSGRPGLELSATVDYQILPSLTAHLALEAVGNTYFGNLYTPTSSSSQAMPVVADMDVSLSYRLHPSVGITVSGLNLFGGGQRWLYYDRPGRAVMGALLFSF